MTSCPEFHKVDGLDPGGGGILACWLPEGHSGPHYDEADDVSWQMGRPRPAEDLPQAIRAAL